MKLPVDRKRTIITFLIADLIFAVLLFASSFWVFLFEKWGIYQWLIIALFIVVSVIMLVLSLTRNFYVIESKYLVVVKGSKNMFYYYTDVVYIDKAQSERKRVLTFATNKGHARYLPFDKDGKIYETMIKRCRNLLSEEEFHSRYPNIKL